MRTITSDWTNLSDEHREISVERKMERYLDGVHLVRPQEVDRVKPVFDGGEALLDHIESQLAGGGVLQVGDQGPHGAGARLQLRREGGVVSVGLELNVRFHLSHIDVHPLEHREKVEPHVEEPLVLHEPVGDGRVGEDVVEVGDEGPVAVVLHDVLGAVDDAVDGTMLVFVLVAGGNSIVNLSEFRLE